MGQGSTPNNEHLQGTSTYLIGHRQPIALLFSPGTRVRAREMTEEPPGIRHPGKPAPVNGFP